MSFPRRPDLGNRRPSTPGSDLGRKLPPLNRDNPTPERTMHQIQLEMEYDVQESDYDSDKPSVRSLGRRPSSYFAEDVGELAAREIHALCIFDQLTVTPAMLPGSPLVDLLSRVPARRSWGRWRWRSQPPLRNPRVIEAIMMYERGSERDMKGRCNRCRAGQGVSPQCVVMPEDIRDPREPGPCSNCLYDDVGHSCNAFGRRTPVSTEKPHCEMMGHPDRVVDHMVVLELIASLKRPENAARDHSLPERARRIEKAALHIAQAAREWGDKLAKEGS